MNLDADSSFAPFSGPPNGDHDKPQGRVSPLEQLNLKSAIDGKLIGQSQPTHKGAGILKIRWYDSRHTPHRSFVALVHE
jgi:hypothetical protein